MSSWRTLLPLAIALVVAVILYPRPGKSREPNGQPQTEITLWLPGSAGDAMLTAVGEFERRHPEYKVRIGSATVRDATGDPTRFLLGVAGGVPPDLINFDRFAVVEAAARGAFRPLNDLLDRDVNAPDAIREDNYFAPMWQEARYRGMQYGIPNSVDIRALFLNDDLLVRAELTNPDGSVRAPKTWEDVCRKKVHAHGTVEGMRVRLGPDWTIPGLGTVPRSGDAPRAGDVIVLIKGLDQYRSRIKAVDADGLLEIDPSPANGAPPGGLPGAFQGAVEAKVFDQDSFAIRLTRFDADGALTTLGFAPLYGNSWLYIYGWQNGAKFMSDDGETCLLNEPAVKAALQYIVDCYDAMGGFKRVKGFESSFQGGAQDPFLSSKIAMLIHGNWFLDTIAAYRPDLRFSLVPAPIPQARLKEGFKPITWAGGWAYAIPATAKHPEAAWELCKFLMSLEGQRLQQDVTAGLARGKGRPFIPPLSVDKRFQTESRRAYMADNPQVTRRLLAAYDTYIGLLPESKFRPVTPVGQKLWMEHAKATDSAVYHQDDVHTALTNGKIQVQRALDRYLHPPAGVQVRWDWVFGLFGLALAGVLGGLIVSERRRRRAGLGRRDWVAGYIGISPWLVGFIVLGAGPILFSLVISFCYYDVLSPARFTGLDNYAHILGFYRDGETGQWLASDPEFWVGIKNTLFMVLSVPLGITLGLAVAMLLNANLRGMAFFRTVFYLPSIVPAVASFLLWIWIFDPTRGILNTTLRSAGMANPPSWLQDQQWSKPALIIMGLWGVGGGMLIWLAGLKNIPAQLYEAAEIDGAGPLRRFWHVTVPMISPYIFFNLIMGMIGVFQTFESAYVMTDGGPNSSTLFYAYKLFNEAFRYLSMGTAAAMAWILFIIVLALTLLQLWLGRKWVHYD